MEVAIVAIIALVVFGPKRLPELGSSLGNGMREFKASVTGDNKNEDTPQGRIAAMSEEPEGGRG